MQKFTQKYTLVQTIKPLPDGYEYSMENWPLHVTLADIFAVQSDPEDLLHDLQNELKAQPPILAKVVADEWFGEDKNVHVMLLEKPDELQALHDRIIDLLETHGVAFNHPEYTRGGFVAHSTVQKSKRLQFGETVAFDAVTLIDMFPDENPYRRKVLGSARLTE